MVRTFSKSIQVPHSPQDVKTKVFKKHQKIDKSCKINDLQDFFVYSDCYSFQKTRNLCGNIVTLRRWATSFAFPFLCKRRFLERSILLWIILGINSHFIKMLKPFFQMIIVHSNQMCQILYRMWFC
jgi:hypothetical protein